MKGETMKDLNPAELIIRGKAIQVVMAARGKHEFIEHRDALEQFKAEAKRIANAY